MTKLYVPDRAAYVFPTYRDFRLEKMPMKLTSVWIATLLLIFTFLVQDAAALAASSSVVALRPFLIEMAAFVAVLAGGTWTAWKMRSH